MAFQRTRATGTALAFVCATFTVTWASHTAFMHSEPAVQATSWLVLSRLRTHERAHIHTRSFGRLGLLLSSSSSASAAEGMEQVAVIGGGMSGLLSAYVLSHSPSKAFNVTVFEKAPQVGGHVAYRELEDAMGRVATVATGVASHTSSFLNFMALLDHLGISEQEVVSDGADPDRFRMHQVLNTYTSNPLDTTIFASPSFWWELIRFVFNILSSESNTLEEHLFSGDRRFSNQFCDTVLWSLKGLNSPDMGSEAFKSFSSRGALAYMLASIYILQFFQQTWALKPPLIIEEAFTHATSTWIDKHSKRLTENVAKLTAQRLRSPIQFKTFDRRPCLEKLSESARVLVNTPVSDIHIHEGMQKVNVKANGTNYEFDKVIFTVAHPSAASMFDKNHFKEQREALHELEYDLIRNAVVKEPRWRSEFPPKATGSSTWDNYSYVYLVYPLKEISPGAPVGLYSVSYRVDRSTGKSIDERLQEKGFEEVFYDEWEVLRPSVPTIRASEKLKALSGKHNVFFTGLACTPILKNTEGILYSVLEMCATQLKTYPPWGWYCERLEIIDDNYFLKRYSKFEAFRETLKLVGQLGFVFILTKLYPKQT